MPTTPAAERALARVRRLCLALPETTEVMAWGHPVFKAGTRTFAAIEPLEGRPSLAFRLEPVDVDLLLSQKSFFETPYGRGLWASTWADARLDWTLIAGLVERSYRIVALKRMLSALDGAAAEPARTARRGRRPERALAARGASPALHRDGRGARLARRDE